MRRAEALWRGPALADVPRSAAVLAAAARLDALRLEATELRLRGELTLGRVTAALPELAGLGAEHPERETLRGLWMEALARSGRTAEALAVFEQTRTALADELGVDPSPGLRAVHLAVLRGEFATATPSTATRATATVGPSLPHPLTRLVGRQPELRLVADLIRRHRLVTITGPGGAGKTKLALAAARDAPVNETMFTETVFVELAAARDIGQIDHALLDAFGRSGIALFDPAGAPRRGGGSIPAEDGGERERPDRDVLLATLRRRSALLVLDNCEHLVGAVAQVVDEMLRLCPGVRVLATSREPLGIVGERLVPVDPLPFPPPDTPWRKIPAYAAVELFLDRARAVRPDFAADDADGTPADHRPADHRPANEVCAQDMRAATLEAVADVCRRLDGLPLALELAAARLRSMPVEQLAARLSDRFAVLTGGGRTAQPRHRSLHAVVAWSWDLLDDAERAVLRRLAASPSGLTLAAAEHVCAGTGWRGDAPADASANTKGGQSGRPRRAVEPSAVLDILASLVDKSLVVAVPDDARSPDDALRGYRYRMLETIRAFAADRLADAGETLIGAARHADWFTELARTARPRLIRSDQLRWIRCLTAEHDNLLSAVRWSVTNTAVENAFQLGATLGWLWSVQGQHRLVLHWLGQIVDMPRPTRRPQPSVDLIRAEATVHVTMTLNVGILEAGEEREKVLAAAEPAVRRALATFSSGQGPRTDAAEAGTSGARVDEGDLALILAFDMFRAMWDADPARVFTETSHLIDSSLTWTSASARLIRGLAAHLHGELATARHELAAAIELFRAAGDRWGLSLALSQAGDLASLDGRHPAAMTAFAEAAGLATEIGAWDDAAALRLRVAMELHRMGRTDECDAEVEQARRFASRHGPGLSSILLDLMPAEVARRSGDRATAVELFHRALASLDGYGPVELTGHAYNGLALVAAASDDLAGAVGWHRRGVELISGLTGVDQRVVTATLLAGLARTVRRFGPSRVAAELLGAAETLRGSLDRGDSEIVATEEDLRRELGASAYAAARRDGAAVVRDGPRDEAGTRLAALARSALRHIDGGDSDEESR